MGGVLTFGKAGVYNPSPWSQTYFSEVEGSITLAPGERHDFTPAERAWNIEVGKANDSGFLGNNADQWRAIGGVASVFGGAAGMVAGKAVGIGTSMIANSLDAQAKDNLAERAKSFVKEWFPVRPAESDAIVYPEVAPYAPFTRMPYDSATPPTPQGEQKPFPVGALLLVALIVIFFFFKKG